METVYVSRWMERAAENMQLPLSALMGEREGELLFYALKNLTLDDSTFPVFRLVFEWPEVYYSSEFFVSLLGMCVDDEHFPYFAHLLMQSDMMQDPEVARLVDVAWDRLGLDGEVLA